MLETPKIDFANFELLLEKVWLDAWIRDGMCVPPLASCI